MQIQLFGLVYVITIAVAVGGAVFLLISGRRSPTPNARPAVAAGAALEILLIVGDPIVHGPVQWGLGDAYLTFLDLWVPFATLLHGGALVLIAVGLRRTAGPREAPAD